LERANKNYFDLYNWTAEKAVAGIPVKCRLKLVKRGGNVAWWLRHSKNHQLRRNQNNYVHLSYAQTFKYTRVI